MKVAVVISHVLKTHSSKYLLEVYRYWLKHGVELDVFTMENEEMKNVKVINLPKFSSKFDVKEGIFTVESTLAVNLVNLIKRYDIVMSQATRFFTPNVAYQQFTYKAWAKFNKMTGIRQKLINWMENRNLRKRMSKNASRISKERGLDVVAKEWEEYFREVYEHIRRSS